MIEKLRELLERAGYSQIPMSLDHVQAVLGSAEQLFAISVYTSAEQLKNGWQSAAHEVASTIQAQLTSELDGLRWDLYLLYLVDGGLDSELRSEIENSRLYFRKLVFTESDQPFENRLPLGIGSTLETRQELILFDDVAFLREFSEVVPQEVITRLGDRFFTDGYNSLGNLEKQFSGGKVD